MNHDDFVKLLEERGDAVYIVDRGLIRFGKFAVALLAMFGIMGVFLFGLDIKKAADEVKLARAETEKTRLELNGTKKQLISAREELGQARESFTAFISEAKQGIQKDLDDATASRKRTLGIEQEVTIIRLRMQQQGQSQDPTAALALAKAGQSDSKEVPAASSLVHIGLVSEIKELEIGDLSRVAAVLQKQVSRDLKPLWNVDATVEVYKTLEDVPISYWPLIIKRDIEIVGANGIHSSRDGRPFALVTYRKDWSRTASHELVDMLVDPLGNRTIPAPSPNPADKNKQVNILVEIAQPVEGDERAYQIDGVLVTDFVTPAFYDPARNKKSRYSFTGSATEPLKILKGGFLSWVDRETEELSQVTWFGDSEPTYRNLGKIN
jgi:hypothetical protein